MVRRPHQRSTEEFAAKKVGLGPFGLRLHLISKIGNDNSADGPFDTAVVETGPNGVPIIGLCGGYVVFDFPQSAAYAGGIIPKFKPAPGKTFPKHVVDSLDERDRLRNIRFKYMNSFLTALLSASSIHQGLGITVQQMVTPDSFLAARMEYGKWRLLAPENSNLLAPKTHDWKIELDTFKKSIDLFNVANEKFGDMAIEVFSILQLACHQYRKHDFASAQLLGWTVAEFKLNFLWRKFLETSSEKPGGHTGINRNRREVLLGRDYTASIISQVLSLTRVIDDDLLKKIDMSRKVRNSFTHQMKPINSKEASSTIQTAATVLTNILETRIICPLGYKEVDFNWGHG